LSYERVGRVAASTVGTTSENPVSSAIGIIGLLERRMADVVTSTLDFDRFPGEKKANAESGWSSSSLTSNRIGLMLN
jgi:hypothetical protein